MRERLVALRLPALAGGGHLACDAVELSRKPPETPKTASEEAAAH